MDGRMDETRGIAGRELKRKEAGKYCETGENAEQQDRDREKMFEFLLSFPPLVDTHEGKRWYIRPGSPDAPGKPAVFHLKRNRK